MRHGDHKKGDEECSAEEGGGHAGSWMEVGYHDEPGGGFDMA